MNRPAVHRRMPTALGLLASLASLSFVLGSACAQGTSDPGIGKDSCKLRDCGPSSGGDVDPLDSGDEDTFVPFEDSKPPLDTGPAGGDTAPSGDTTSVDTTPSGDTTPPPPDTAGCTPPAGKACGTLPQCGCKTGEKCDVTASDGTTGCIAEGAKGLDQKCTALADCAKGYSCVGSLCRPFCASAADCTGTATGACKPVQDSSTPPKDIPGFLVCFVSCDPMLPSKTCGTQSCAFLDSKTTTCTVAGAGTTAGSCTSATAACAAGYACIGTGDCRRWCRVGHDVADCGGTKICQGFAVPPTYGTYTYGVCTYT